MRIFSKPSVLIKTSIVALAVATTAQAQTTPEVAAADEAATDTIVVTGSRLKRDPNATAPLPISSVSADQLRANGATDVTAALRQIPALLASTTVADSIERGGVGVGIGQATLNLRQLGANRTLVLVDGYRHVSGVAGSQAVDVSTIPAALIERVEVLTGGASAVYGADAVTGVVNYILKQDFDGIALDAQSGISSRGDGQSWRIAGTIGKNFAEGRGNVTVSASYTNDDEILLGQREFTADNGRGNNSTTYANPALRFQRGDIDATATPNFATRFSQAAGRFPIGFAIPTAAQFATQFPGRTPTAAEQALIDRAANAPSFVIGRDPRFAISSGQGLIFRNDFGFFNADINNNGVNDCRESYIGLTGFGGGGCYVSTAGGGVKIFEDGIISTSQNQFGGDGAVERTNDTSLIPRSERINVNFRASFEFSPAAEVFVDAKYTRNNSISRNSYNTFYDSLLIFPDNPFIPAVLQDDADEAGGLRVSRDFLDLGSNVQTANRDTYRVVGGLRGQITPNLRYELVGNYGRTDNTVTQGNSVRYDRLFAAIDVVRGPNGQPICRSDIDPTPHPGSEIFPVIAPGFFTFRPGDGSCRPANILSGEQSVSAAARDFITTPTTDRFTIEQTVITLSFTGDSGAFLNLPGGAIGFAVGGEYRKEKSRSRFSDLELGLLPANSPAGPAGTFIGDISDNNQLIFDPSTRTFNTQGSFDVKEIFGEVNLPILKDRPFFHELSLGAAGRYADYSTIGGAFTWNVNGVWSPIEDIRFRGTYARAIRAPNIFELFSPEQGTTFRPSDPCDVVNQNATPNRLANCVAAATALGIPNAAAFIANYSDPLSARFSGTTGGNPELTEERARTWSVGAVVQPSFLPGLTMSADYYSIRIDNGIQAPQAQDIANSCYDASSIDNQYCALITRNGPGAGASTFGFNFLRQRQLNFSRIETSGIDFSLGYNHRFDALTSVAFSLAGNWTEKVDRYFDPTDPDLVNPSLRELSVPEWSGNANLQVTRGAFTIGYNLQYIQSTAAAISIEIERIEEEFGPAGFAPDYWIHGVNFNFDVDERFSFYGGVNNLTNAEPYISSSAYPVSGIGRFYFLGLRAKL